MDYSTIICLLFVVVTYSTCKAFTINGGVMTNVGIGKGKTTVNGVTYESGDINIPFYRINTNKYWKYFWKCYQKTSVIGKGVKDEFEEPCSNEAPGVLMSSKCLTVGDPNHAFSLYSDEFGKLTVIKKGICTLRSYKTEKGVTKHTDTPLAVTECNAVKSKMSEQLEKNNAYWRTSTKNFEELGKAFTAGFKDQNEKKGQFSSSFPSSAHGELSPPKALNTDNKGDKNTADTKFHITTSPIENQDVGSCKERISLDGRGVRDTFLLECSKEEADIMNKDGVLIFGNPKKNSFSLYSDTLNTLVVINGKVCTKKTYSVNDGVIRSVRSPITTARCAEIKRKMAEALDNNKPS